MKPIFLHSRPNPSWIALACFALASPVLSQDRSYWSAIGCWTSTEGIWDSEMSWRSDSLWIEWQGDTKASIELWNRGAIQAKDSIAGRVLSGRWEIRDSNLRFEPWQQSRPPRGETTSEIGQTWECRVQFPDRWSLALCCEDFCQSPSQALRFTRSTRSGCPR